MGTIREDLDGQEDEPYADERDSAEWVRRAVGRLGDVEQDLIYFCYWDGEKLKTMARRHGFTTSRADQRLDHAIEELRYMLEPEYAKGA
jgi:DNA-directed RNA polymerase specialized sigma24 family protein